MRCVLIDDSCQFLAAAARLLESQGIDVVACATSTSEALERVAALEPNLALVDIELGEEDGIALAQQLAVRSPSVRVVLISAYDPTRFAPGPIDAPSTQRLPPPRLPPRRP